MLLAIHSMLASWSRLDERIRTAEIAKLARVSSDRHVRESISRLEAAGAIWREKSLGRYPSRYGLPCPPAGSIDPALPQAVSDVPTLPEDGPPTLPRGGQPSEDSPEETAAASARAHGQRARRAAQAPRGEGKRAEHAARLSELIAPLTGTPPVGAQFERWLRSYTEAPAGFTRLVAAVRKGNARSQVALLDSKLKAGAHLIVVQGEHSASPRRPILIEDECMRCDERRTLFEFRDGWWICTSCVLAFTGELAGELREHLERTA